MLSKKYRLPIQSVIGKRAKIIKSRYFSIKIFPNSLLYCRFGVSISKKVSAKAVIRNKIKRQIFNGIRKEFFESGKSGKFSEGNDFLIILYPEIGRLDKNEITRQFNEIINKIK